MEMRLPKYETMVSGVSQSQTFDLALNATIFHVLFSGIYSDKIASPIRELCTNARDAHVVRGNRDRPFDLHLPSELDPTFWVRDYGIGMTDEVVNTIYRTIGESLHRLDANCTGSMGLGKVSPLGYTSSFVLTCYLDGQERVYSIFINDQGQPELMKVYEGTTDEEQGVKVAFAVNNDDIKTFRNKTQVQLLGFDPRPNVVNENSTWTYQETKLHGTGWRYYEGLNETYVRQGSVVYPINTTEAYYLYGSKGLVLDFDLGQLSVTSSREELAYDSETKKALTNKFNQVKVEIAAMIEKEIMQASTLVDACMAWTNLSKGFPSTLVPSHTKWNDKYVGRKPYSREEVGIRFIVPHQTSARDFDLRWSFSRRQSDPDVSTYRDNVFLYAEPNLPRQIQRIRRLIHEGKLNYGESVWWSKTKIDGLNYIDLKDVEPLNPVRTSSGTYSPKAEGMNMAYVTSRNIDRETFVPTDDLLFIRSENLKQIPLRGRLLDRPDLRSIVYELATVGVISDDQKVVVMDQKLEARLKKAKVKIRILEDVARVELRKKFDLSLMGEMPYQDYRDFSSAKDLVIRLQKLDATFGRFVNTFMKRMEKWDTRPTSGMTPRVISQFLDDEVPKTCSWTTDNQWRKLKERLPLIDEVSRSNLAYYLKLEGQLK